MRSLFAAALSFPLFTSSVAPVGIVQKPPIRDVLECERVDIETRTDPEEPAPEPAATTNAATTQAAPRPAVRREQAAVAAPTDVHMFDAALEARIDELPMCRRGDASGPGTAEVVFVPEGGASVKLSAPYAGTATGRCVGRRLAMAAQPYAGMTFVVRLRFSL